MRCPKCGAENRDGAKFCNECAAPLPAKCPSCGSLNQAGSKFCDECGAQITAALSKSPIYESSPPVRVATVQPEAFDALEGERKTVTALFADLKGSTELMEDLGAAWSKATSSSSRADRPA